MRIIGGEARGRRLFAPEGLETRPTADRVRESLFNILSARVYGARVLDLFSGSGAMALEAVSRGAESAVLVDSSRKAASCIARNVDLVGAKEKTRLLTCDFRAAIDRLDVGSAPFDLVFMDPPYRLHEVYAQAAEALLRRGLLAPEALLVLEHESGFDLTLDAPFAACDRRVYGAAAVTFFRVEVT